MNSLLGLNIELHIDHRGNLKVTTKGDIGDIYIVVGFKVKIYNKMKCIFPVLRIETQKK